MLALSLLHQGAAGNARSGDLPHGSAALAATTAAAATTADTVNPVVKTFVDEKWNVLGLFGTDALGQPCSRHQIIGTSEIHGKPEELTAQNLNIAVQREFPGYTRRQNMSKREVRAHKSRYVNCKRLYDLGCRIVAYPNGEKIRSPKTNIKAAMLEVRHIPPDMSPETWLQVLRERNRRRHALLALGKAEMREERALPAKERDLREKERAKAKANSKAERNAQEKAIYKAKAKAKEHALARAEELELKREWKRVAREWKQDRCVKWEADQDEEHAHAWAQAQEQGPASPSPVHAEVEAPRVEEEQENQGGGGGTDLGDRALKVCCCCCC